MRKIILFFMVYALCLCAADVPPPHPEEIIDLQNGVKGQLVNLKRRLQDISERIEKISKEDAQKVRNVEVEFRSRDIVHQMETIKEKLQSQNFTSAFELQTSLINELQQIIQELEGRRQDVRDWDKKLEKVRMAGKMLRGLLEAQKGLRRGAEKSVSDQREAGTLSAMAREVQKILTDQKGLSERLPGEKMEDELFAEELQKQLGQIITGQNKLFDKVKNAPEENELTGIRSKAESLEKAIDDDTFNEKDDKLVKDLVSSVKNVLGNKKLGDLLDSSRGNKKPGWKTGMKRVLRRIKAESGKGAMLSSHVPEQASLEYKVRELAKGVEQKLANSKDKAGDSYSKGNDSLKAAAADMKNSSKALSSGQKKLAAGSQQKAIENLREAQKSFSKMNNALKGRSGFERAEYKQNKLRKKTGELVEKSQRLRKLLGRKKEQADLLKKVENMLSKAGSEMDKASKEFAGGNNAGLESAGKAAKELKSAKDILEKESAKRLRRLEELKKLAKKQKELEKKAGEMARDFKSGNENSLRRAGSSVEKSGKQMGKASSKFDRGDAEEGARAQDKAAEELAKAQRELNDEQEELERLKQEEELTNMLQLLVKIRDSQKEIYTEIVNAEQSRKAEGRLLREKRLLLRELSIRQRKVIGKSEEVRDLLKKEKAQVFVFVVEDILGDMAQINEGISKRNPETGRFIQILANEVIEKINQLLSALKEELAKRKQPKAKDKKQQGGQQARRVLIPPVAEALMLKRMQLGLNMQTEELERSRVANGGKLNNPMERHLKRLALKQGALESLTKKVAKNFFGMTPGEKENEPEEKKNP